MLCRKILTLRCFNISSGSSVILSGRSRKEKVHAHSYKTSGTTCQNSRTEGLKLWKIWKCAKKFRYLCKPVMTKCLAAGIEGIWLTILMGYDIRDISYHQIVVTCHSVCRNRGDLNMI